jgi:anti-anti-sigma factor
MLGICTARGDIDRATAPAFIVALRGAIDSSDEAVVSVDCANVTFMDSAGYHALIDATKYAARRGHTLVIRDPSSSCEMLIRLCDLHRELRVGQ